MGGGGGEREGERGFEPKLLPDLTVLSLTHLLLFSFFLLLILINPFLSGCLLFPLVCGLFCGVCYFVFLCLFRVRFLKICFVCLVVVFCLCFWGVFLGREGCVRGGLLFFGS